MALGMAEGKHQHIVLNTGDDVATFVATFTTSHRTIDKLNGFPTPEYKLKHTLANAIKSSSYETVRSNLMTGECTFDRALKQLVAMENAIKLQELDTQFTSANVASVERYPKQRASSRFDNRRSENTRQPSRTKQWTDETKEMWRLYCGYVGGRGKDGTPAQNALKQAWKAALGENGTITSKNIQLMKDAEDAAKTTHTSFKSMNAVDVFPSDSDESDDFYELSNLYTEVSTKSYAKAARSSARK